MTCPKTWELLGAFETCLARISVANGYATEAGAVVTREPTPLPDTQRIAVGIEMDVLGRPEDPAQKAVGDLTGIVVSVRLGAAVGEKYQQLHYIVADVRRALKDQHASFPNGTQFPVFRQAKFIPLAEGMNWIGADLFYSSTISNRT